MCEGLKEFVKPSVCVGWRGEGVRRFWGCVGGGLYMHWSRFSRSNQVMCVCVKRGADIGHVLLCDHTCEVVYEWGVEERSDVRASVWGVEQ